MSIWEKYENLSIEYVGTKDYGGMSGRDMESVAIGLQEGIDDHYLAWRIGQVQYLGDRLFKAGIPIVEPVGGHTVYLDTKRFLTPLPQSEFCAQDLSASIYVNSGVRSMERGTLSAGRDKIEGLKLVYEPENLRFFKSRFEPVDKR